MFPTPLMLHNTDLNKVFTRLHLYPKDLISCAYNFSSLNDNIIAAWQQNTNYSNQSTYLNIKFDTNKRNSRKQMKRTYYICQYVSVVMQRIQWEGGDTFIEC